MEASRAAPTRRSEAVPTAASSAGTPTPEASPACQPGQLAAAGTAALPSVRWSGRTRGGYFGNWWFVQLIRLFGLRAAYAWLTPVAAYFLVASPLARRSSVQFLSRALGPQPLWKRLGLVYRHFYAYGVTLLDRLALIMGRTRMDCRYEGETMFREFLDQGRGIILLGAHLGGWEMGGHLLGRHGKPVNMVVVEKEEARIRQLFDHALQAKQFRLLTTDDHPLRSIPILAALKRGEIILLHGDRSFGGEDLAVPFFGHSARFPVGAYKLAAASGAPLFQVFAVRERVGEYRFFSFPPQFIAREVLRQPVEALRPYVAQFVQRLETVARQYPFQWLNLYPFWDEPT